MKLTEIHLNPKNPRTIKTGMFKKLVQSLKEFPKMMELRPIIIDETNMIQGGNMRFLALQELGYKEVPDSWIRQGKDLTQEQWREFVVKDNLAFGEWDMDMLAADYDIEELMAWGFEMPEFFEKQEPEVQEDHYEIPDKIATDIQTGDVITIGRHRLLCGDATKAEDHTKLMDGQKADLVATDPPYNVNYGDKAEMLDEYLGGTRNDSRIQNDNMSDGDFYKFLFDFYKQMIGSLKEGGSFYIFHADTQGYNFRKALRDNGVTIRQCLVWVKNSLVLGRQDYHWRHEPILYGWKPGAAHYFIEDRTQTTVIDDKIDIKKLKRDELLEMLKGILSERTPTTVIYHDRPSTNDLHPTMKPVTLMGYLIKNSSRITEKVLDPFAGSGSTMVAAHQLKRRCYAMEIDPQYCEIIIDRMTKFDPGLKVTRNGQEYRNGSQQSAAVPDTSQNMAKSGKKVNGSKKVSENAKRVAEFAENEQK